MAARFSATNSTFLPRAIMAAMRLEMVWLLPVPGGPSKTKDPPPSAALMARFWEESASSTKNSSVGATVSGREGSTSPEWRLRRASRAPSSPARAAIRSCCTRTSRLFSMSLTMGSFLYMKFPSTNRPGSSSKSGTRPTRAPRSAKISSTSSSSNRASDNLVPNSSSPETSTSNFLERC